MSEKKGVAFVKWFSELNKDSGKYAGGKGANLAEIFNLKVPVPPGFVVTAQAYDYFIEKAGIKEKMKELLGEINYEDTSQLDKITEEIRNLMLKSPLPNEMQEEIIESYDHLDTEGFDFEKGSALDILNKTSEPLFVAVRSSATAEDLADASFAGQQDSFVNVKGNASLIIHIKKCFASLFTSRATYYRNKKGFKHEQVSIAVVVQKMVDSDKSGVIFSKDPSNRNENITIEAVFGLGEGIVSGKITPDKYILSQELEILDKKISNKKIAITRDSSGGKTTVKLSEERSNSQVLKDYEMKKLTELALQLEEHYKKPQDIEFAIEGEGIYIVQTRPITTRDKKNRPEEKEIKGEVILTGIPASPGIASGKIKIVKDMKDLSKIKQGDILVTEMTNPDMVVTMQRSAGIVTDEGGMTSHAAIVSREMGIPAIVGTQEATTKLKEGEIITVDGFNGKVYKGKTSENVQKEVLPVETKTKTEIKVIVDLPTFAKRASLSGIKKVGLTRIEGIIAESGKHPKYFQENKRIQDYENIIYEGISKIAKYFNELWIRTSDIRSDEFSNLEGAPKEKEGNPMLGNHGIRFSLKNPDIFKAELNALKKVSQQGKKIGILLPQIISVDEVQKTKKILEEIDFKDVKIGVMVETPAAVQIIKDLCDEGIDFISFGTNDLTQYILAIDRNNPEVQDIYNEMNPAILYQLAYVIRICKRKNVESSICGQAGSRKEMVKFLVENDIDSISVNADMAKEISEYVAEIEKEKGESPRQYTKEVPEIPGGKNEILPKKEIEEKVDLEEPTYLEGEEAVEATEKEKLEYSKEDKEEYTPEEKEDIQETPTEKEEETDEAPEKISEEPVNEEPIEEPPTETKEPEKEEIQDTQKTPIETKEEPNELTEEEKTEYPEPESKEENTPEYLTGEEAVEATEKEKQEYSEEKKEEPEEKEEIQEEDTEENKKPNSSEFDEEPEFKDKEEVLDIF